LKPQIRIFGRNLRIGTLGWHLAKKLEEMSGSSGGDEQEQWRR